MAQATLEESSAGVLDVEVCSTLESTPKSPTLSTGWRRTLPLHRPRLLSRRPPPHQPRLHQPPLHQPPRCHQRPQCHQRSPQLLCLRKLPQLKLVPPCIDTRQIYNNWLYQAFLWCPVLNKILTLVC